MLTFWQGTLATPPAYTNAPGGSSEPGSCYYILDNTYKVIKTVSAQRGFTSDIHEFLITPKNTALLLSTKTISMDLRPYGGPQEGFIQDFAIQEIDLETNQLLFFWDALQHIPLTDPALNLVYAAQFPSPNYTYRAYRDHWVGKPCYPPSIGVRFLDCQTIVYASWNGSTETAQWQVFAGLTPKRLCLVHTVQKKGFETAIPVQCKGPYFRVKALVL